MFKKIFAAILFCCMILSLGGCGQAAEDSSTTDSSGNDTQTVSSAYKFTDYGFYFDTEITITLYGTNDQSLMDGCFALAEKYEQMFSRTIETSEISQINTAQGAPVTVSDETIELIQKGIDYGKLSGGKFDITIGKLSSLWNFSENDGYIPDSAQILEAVSTIDYTAIVIEGNTVTLTNPDTMIDLGGIAKGYVADQMKQYLVDNGCTSALINLGGNVLTVGSKPDGSAYKIGVQKPFSSGDSIAALDITDQSVVSSGVYERYIEVNNVRYHHILNPETGFPYENNLYGVTIISDKSVDGDGLSTTCFALGLEDGMELIESLDGVEAIFITDDYELHTSSGMGTTIPYEKLG
jgi:thiamine biosynthesis lipoprotein